MRSSNLAEAAIDSKPRGPAEMAARGTDTTARSARRPHRATRSTRALRPSGKLAKGAAPTPADHGRVGHLRLVERGAGDTYPEPSDGTTARTARSPVGEALLLRRARLGDRRAENALLERHEPLVRRVCRGFFLPNGETGDLLQAARVGLWQSIHCWDPDRGTQFRHFAMLVMRREVMMLVSSSRARNQGLLNSACSLHAEYAPGADGANRTLAEMLAAPARDANDPAEITLWRERLALILAGLPALSEHERGSLAMTLNGLGQPEIGAELGTGAKSVNNALQRARKKLRAAL
jgi:RNA polymerase sporulation-specific sigma factor